MRPSENEAILTDYFDKISKKGNILKSKQLDYLFKMYKQIIYNLDGLGGVVNMVLKTTNASGGKIEV